MDDEGDHRGYPGRLLIIGGAEDRCRGAGLLERFVGLCGGDAARIVLVTTAIKGIRFPRNDFVPPLRWGDIRVLEHILAMMAKHDEARVQVDSALELALNNNLPMKVAMAYRVLADLRDFKADYNRGTQTHKCTPSPSADGKAASARSAGAAMLDWLTRALSCAQITL